MHNAESGFVVADGEVGLAAPPKRAEDPNNRYGRGSLLGELARLTRYALVNDTWNRGWTAFTEQRHPEALLWQRKTT